MLVSGRLYHDESHARGVPTADKCALESRVAHESENTGATP